MVLRSGRPAGQGELELPPDDPLVFRAMAEVALGVTIQIRGKQFTRIAEASIAVTDPTGETTFLSLDS